MKAEIKDNKLVITIELDATPKETEKMFLVASSGGFKDSGTTYKGKDLRVNIMAGYRK